MAQNTGIGIHNTRRRLDLLYQNRHKLEIAEDAITYTVNLNIQLS
jgi:sensor histidine kinase YesM